MIEIKYTTAGKRKKPARIEKVDFLSLKKCVKYENRPRFISKIELRYKRNYVYANHLASR